MSKSINYETWEPTPLEESEMRHRALVIRSNWSSEERLKRQHAEVVIYHVRGHSWASIKLPPLLECEQHWQPPVCHADTQQHFAEEPHRLCDCPYWMHDPLPRS